MNRRILQLALPSIVSNIVVPLLGLMDLTIAGHLGATSFIGAIAVGAMMFNLTYWNFGFLRMGTSGMTAQAFGRGDTSEAFRVLVRAATLGTLLGLVIIALQFPLQWLLLLAIGPSAEVTELARSYFYICVWGAPAMLATMSLSGWFLGMQNSVYPMTVSIFVNILNITASLACVFLLDMGFRGVAVGTLVSQWGGLLLSLFMMTRLIRRHGIRLPQSDTGSRSAAWMRMLDVADMGKFFTVNRDIFLRSLCLMLVTLFFTSAGARSGDLTLAVNALIMQLFVLYSYFMDGFAFAGEALVGRYTGERNDTELRRCIRGLFLWGTVVMTVFALAYGLAGSEIMSLLTDDRAVVQHAAGYRWWSVVIPIVGMGAFIWDGVYIGLTATRQMLIALFSATIAFFGLYYGLSLLSPDGFFADPNNILWISFIAYLFTRSAAQSLMAPRLLRQAF